MHVIDPWTFLLTEPRSIRISCVTRCVRIEAEVAGQTNRKWDVWILESFGIPFRETN